MKFMMYMIKNHILSASAKLIMSHVQAAVTCASGCLCDKGASSLTPSFVIFGSTEKKEDTAPWSSR